MLLFNLTTFRVTSLKGFSRHYGNIIFRLAHFQVLINTFSPLAMPWLCLLGFFMRGLQFIYSSIFLTSYSFYLFLMLKQQFLFLFSDIADKCCSKIGVVTQNLRCHLRLNVLKLNGLVYYIQTYLMILVNDVEYKLFRLQV